MVTVTINSIGSVSRPGGDTEVRGQDPGRGKPSHR